MSLSHPRIPIYGRTIRTLTLVFAVGPIGWFILPDGLINKFQPIVRAAATFRVDSLGDTPDVAPGNGMCADSLGACTLRAAIQEANILGGDDTINFSVIGTINLTSALPNLTTNMIISGPGSSQLTIRRNTGGEYRIFSINGSTVTISGLTITNGRTPDGTPGVNNGGNGGNGGGIFSTGSLSLTDVTITGNSTGNGGVANGSGSSFGGWGGFGGGIYGSGTLTMTNCVVNGNQTGSGATGGFGGSGGRGGGIYFEPGTAMLSNVTITGNQTGDGGTGIGAGLSGGNSGYGGGVWSGATLNMTNVSISNNSTGNVVRGNAGGGGGLYIISGTANLVNSSVSNNRLGSGSGFLSSSGAGGGIFNNGTLTAFGSTISGNTTGSSDLGGSSVGGGISNNFILTMTNSTVSGNSTGSGGRDGGGIYSGATLTMTNCTVTGNTAFNNNGNGVAGGNTTNVRNTIIAGNGGAGAPDVSGMFGSQGHNLIGKSDGTNGFGNGVNGDLVGTLAAPLDPMLGALANNGGPTQTTALLVGSPAIDAGDNCVLNNSCSPSLPSAITTDQRGTGFNRPLDGNGDGVSIVDIGAYETGDILVTNTADSGPGSLRQAILDANANAAHSVIGFQTGLTGTITLLSALPDLSTSLTIAGPGANQLTVKRSTAVGTPDFRIFTINSGKTVSISDLTIANGNVTDADGGGLLNLGTLTMANCNIYDNKAGTAGFNGLGGGIYNAGPSLILDNCNIGGQAVGQPNTCGASGGGIANNGTLLMTGGSIVGNSNQGIFTTGTATLIGVAITHNSTNNTGGGIYSGGGANIIDCLIANNTADSVGGGISGFLGTTNVVNSTITGNSSRNAGGGGVVTLYANVILTNVTVTNNRSVNFGGGIDVLGGILLRNTIVAGNFRGTGSISDDINGLVNATSSYNLVGIDTLDGHKQRHERQSRRHCPCSNRSPTWPTGG